MSLNVDKIKKDILSLANPAKAKVMAGFFKTGKGQYGEGDFFLGLTVPQQRIIAKHHRQLPLADLEGLLRSPEHEFRLTALLILVDQFKRANDTEKAKLHRFYMENTKWVNNWDLVDSSAEYLVGMAIEDGGQKLLPLLSKSKSLWERRIAIVSTFAFIKRGDPKMTLKIAEILLKDDQDLIHKAVGWMLREVGKRCGEAALEVFLQKHHKTMPRTMLRYAIERLSPDKRKRYMAK